MRNANKSPNIPYSTVVRGVKSDPESLSGTRSLSKVTQFLQLVGPIIAPSFSEISWLLLQ